jgi:glycosyltransferase involved in cell wall biosynthesis
MRDFWLTESQPRFTYFDSLGKRFIQRATSLVITNSAATASHLPFTSKVHIVHNGLDVAEYTHSNDSVPFRQEHEIPIEVPLVGMVGRLRPWKGQERFLHMASEVLTKLPKAHFILVGGDPFHIDEGYINDLKSLTQALGIRNNVTFTDHLVDIRPALSAMHVFVHPGDPEPFGMVNIEAMASGKPVVAFAQGALPEIVVPNMTGILVSPGDVNALAQAVIGLLQDQERSTEMGQCGRQRVLTQFTIRQTTHKVDRLFHQMLK